MFLVNPKSHFSGHHISKERISPLPETVFIQDFPIPATMRQLRLFLGLINFYCRFLLHCAQVLLPLTSLLTNVRNCDFALSKHAVGAFNKVKAMLQETIKLSHIQSNYELCLAVFLGQMFSQSDSPDGLYLPIYIEYPARAGMTNHRRHHQKGVSGRESMFPLTCG